MIGMAQDALNLLREIRGLLAEIRDALKERQR